MTKLHFIIYMHFHVIAEHKLMRHQQTDNFLFRSEDRIGSLCMKRIDIIKFLFILMYGEKYYFIYVDKETSVILMHIKFFSAY